jgi:hypothetical protein
MATITKWGVVDIDERELVSLKLTYGIRLPKLQTKYYDPIIQYAGKDVTRIYLEFMTCDRAKAFQIWADRLALATSIRAVTVGGVSYGNFYLVKTDVDWKQAMFQVTDNLAERVTNSEFVLAQVSLEGVQ